MNRQKGLFSFIVLLIVLFVPSSFAVYEDQNEIINWEESLVGKPNISFFQKVLGRSNLFVATKKNVIANLNLRTKTINWRHVFKNDETIVAMKPLDGNIVTVTEADTSYLRIWNGQKGYLISEYAVETEKAESKEKADILVLDDCVYALIRGQDVIKMNASKTQQWRQNLNSTTYKKLFSNGNSLVIVGKDEKSHLIVSILDLKYGKLLNEFTIKSITLDDESTSVFYQGKDLIVKDTKGKLWMVNQEETSAKALDLEDLKIESVQELTQITDAIYSIKNEKNQDMIVTIKNKKIIKTLDYENNEAGLVSTFNVDDKHYVSKVSLSKDKKKSLVEVIDVNDPKSKKLFEIETNYYSNGEIINTYLDSYQIRDGSTLFRILTLTQDGSIHLYKESTLVWDREEALTEVVDAKFIALPDQKLLESEIENEKEAGQSKSFIDQFAARVKTQLDDIKEIFGSKKIYNSGEINEQDIMVRDSYGFRQALLFLSKSGKMVCMDTLTKETIWSRFIGYEVEGFNGIKITTLRSSAVKYPPIVAILGTYLENGQKEENTIVYRLNAITGKNVKYTHSYTSVTKFPFKVKQSFRLPIEEKQSNCRVLVLVASESKAVLHPSTPEVLKEFEELDQRFYFNLNDEIGGNTLRGFRLYAGKDQSVVVQSLYNTTFPENEKIAAYGIKEPYDHVASLGKVLGNRSVLYKYLNPNILAVSTIKPNKEYTSELAVYIIDTVKGSIIHHSVYEGGGESINMKPKIIQYENSIVCTFWNHGSTKLTTSEERDAEEEANTFTKGKNGKNARNKKQKKLQKIIKKGANIVSFELYESEIENQSDLRKEFTSYEYLQPYIVSRSYLFDNSILSIGVTTTRNSIPNREVIVGLDNDEMLGINSLYIDPRRKNSPPTDKDKEERLIQYHPLISTYPKHVMSTTYTVSGVEKILSNPATLESTSLVVGYGLDIFLTRRSPSNSFDVLSDTFNKPVLALTIAIVFILVIVTNQLIKKKEFKKVWNMK